MSPLPHSTRPFHPPSPTSGPVHHADVIELRPRTADRAAVHAPGPVDDPLGDTVVLGRSIPYRAPAVAMAATAARPVEASLNPVAEAPIVDNIGLHELLVGRTERNDAAPPPPRVRHRPWMLSSILIAGGGVLAVRIAGEFGEVPLVATIALLAAVLCGAILVAAQLAEEVRRARATR